MKMRDVFLPLITAAFCRFNDMYYILDFDFFLSFEIMHLII